MSKSHRLFASCYPLVGFLRRMQHPEQQNLIVGQIVQDHMRESFNWPVPKTAMPIRSPFWISKQFMNGRFDAVSEIDAESRFFRLLPSCKSDHIFVE